MKSHTWPCWFYFNVRFVQGLFQLPLCQLLQDFPITPINTASPHSLSPPVRDMGMVHQHWRISGQNWVTEKHEGLWHKYRCQCVYIPSISSATNESGSSAPQGPWGQMQIWTQTQHHQPITMRIGHARVGHSDSFYLRTDLCMSPTEY